MEKVNFRCKDQGWENFGMKEYGSSKEVYISKSKDPYMQMFLSVSALDHPAMNVKQRH